MLKSPNKYDGSGTIYNPGSSLLTFSLITTVFLVVFSPLIEASEGRLIYSSSTLRQFGYGTGWLITVFAIPFIGWRILVGLIPATLYLFAAWILLSTLWSPDPLTSVIRVGLILVMAWNVIIPVRYLGFSRSVNILTAVMYLVLMANLITVFLAPSIGTNYHPHPILNYQWRGLMTDKNYAGAVSALLILLIAFSNSIRSATWRAIAILPPLVFLACSLSKTAAIGLVTAIAIGLVSRLRPMAHVEWARGRLSKLQLSLIWLPYGAVLSVAALISIYPDAVAPVFNDQSVVSNRGAIWWPLLQQASQHPMAGIGYGALWSRESAASVAGQSQWIEKVTQAHNGYLDLLLQTGLVGLAIGLLVFYADPMRRIMIMTRNIHSQKAPLCVTIIVFCLISNISESGLLTSDTVWSLYIAIAIGLIYGRSSKLRVRRRRLTNNVNNDISVHEGRMDGFALPASDKTQLNSAMKTSIH